MQSSTPVFNSVVDYGLRDVGVENRPRKLAAYFGKSSILAAVAWVVSVLTICTIVRQTGAPGLMVPAFAVAGTVGLFALAIRRTKRSPVVVVRLTAEGGRRAALLLTVPYLLIASLVVVVAGAAGIPVVVLGLALTAFVWRRRETVPEVLRELRPLLAEDEQVLGDAVGMVQGMRSGYDAFRLMIATDRRLLILGSARSKRPFRPLDIPYRRVERFGLEWPYRGRFGKLSLTVAAADDASETHVVGHITPANLLSIARALRMNGVDADDPEGLEAAERAWEAAKARSEPVAPAPRGLRQAVSGKRLIQISGVLVVAVVGLAAVGSAAGFDAATIRMAVDEAFADQKPVDGRSNLTGNDASLTYSPGPDLREFIVDEGWDAGPNDGAHWELRSSFTKGYNIVSLSHYVFDDPRLESPAAVAGFVADKDREHSRLAGKKVTHSERVADGRRGYVWTYRSRRGYWEYAAWFPQPVHTIRVECIAKRQENRFRRLCSEALASLEFH